MNLEFLEREARADVLREFAKVTVTEVIRLKQENSELKQAQAATEEQIRLGYQDKLTKLKALLFGQGKESLDKKKSLKPRRNTDVLPHGVSSNPDEDHEKKLTAKDRDLAAEISLYAMAETELQDEAVSRGHKGAKPSDWEEVGGLFDESTEITIIERVYKKVIHRRKKYRFKPSIGTDKEIIVTAKGPEKLMPGAGFSIDFAIAVACDKYQRHLPLNRQVEFMESRGLTGITAKTLYGLVDALSSHAVRAGVLEKIRQDIFSVPLAVHADETPWPILDDHDSDGYLWTICNMAGAYYRFEPSRSGKIIVEMLKGYSGPLLTDDFAGYDRVTKETKCILCHCWAHARRNFYNIRENHYEDCREIILMIDELHDVEREAGRSFEKLKQLREEKSRDIVARIKAWLDEKNAKYLLSEDEMGKAIRYVLRNWKEFTRFLDDIRVPLTNNHAERALRPGVLGKNNFYGSKTINGADVAAVHYTIVETCKLVQLEPEAYYRYIVETNNLLATFPQQSEAAGSYNLGGFWRQPGCRSNSIGFVQGASVGTNVAGTSMSTLTTTLTPTTGNFLVVVAYVNSSTPTTGFLTFQVSDSLGNTWNATPPFGTKGLFQFWYATNVTGGSSDTVTLIQNHPVGYGVTPSMAVLEYSGIALTNALDTVVGQANAGGTTLSTGAMTITGGCDLGLSVLFTNNAQTITSTGGIANPRTSYLTIANNGEILADNLPSGAYSGQSITTTGTVPAGHTWTATEAAFVAKGYTFSPPAPTQLAFTTSPQTLTTYACSGAIGLQTQNGSGSPTNTETNLNINLGGTNVQFYQDSNCLLPISSTTIYSGSNSQTVYAMFSATTSGLITATPTNGFSAVSQTEVLSVAPVWIGGASCDGNWATGACWSTGTPPTSTQTAHFDGSCSSNCNATLSASTSIGGLWLHSTMSSSSTVNLSSFTLTLSNLLPQGSEGLIMESGILNGNTGTLTLNGGLRLLGGTFNGNSSTINVAGVTFYTSGGSLFVPGTSTLNFNGTSASGGPFTFGNVTTTGAVSLSNTTTLNGNLTVNASSTLTAQGLTLGGNFTNNGTLSQGTAYTTSTSTTGTHTIGGSSATTFGGALNIHSATTLGAAITVTTYLTIYSSATLSSAGNNITVGTNWFNSGTYTASGSETVTFAAGASHTISGSSATTFGGLVMNDSSTTTTDSLTFPAGLTTTVTSTLTLVGNSSHSLSLVSSTPGTQWILAPPASTTLGGHLTVQDSDSSTTIHSGSGSTNSGNNTNWVFP